jgi:hypothetical protein
MSIKIGTHNASESSTYENKKLEEFRSLALEFQQLLNSVNFSEAEELKNVDKKLADTNIVIQENKAKCSPKDYQNLSIEINNGEVKRVSDNLARFISNENKS